MKESNDLFQMWNENHTFKIQVFLQKPANLADSPIFRTFTMSIMTSSNTRF